MKKLLALLVLLPVLGQSQNSEIPLKDGLPFYEKVVQLDSTVSKASILEKGKVLFVKGVKNTETAFQFEDEQSSKIVGNARFTLKYGHAGSSFKKATANSSKITFLIEIKAGDNGKYRIRCYDFTCGKNSIATLFGYGVRDGSMAVNSDPYSYAEFVQKAKSGKDWAVEGLDNFQSHMEFVLDECTKVINQAAEKDNF